MARNFAEAAMVRGINGGMAFTVDNAVYVNPRSRWQQAIREGRAFNWSSLTYDMAAADTVFALENNDTGRDLHIWQISLGPMEATTCQIFTAKGITVAGATAIPGYPLNRNFQTTPLATATTKETGQDEAGSSWPSRLYMLNLLADTVCTIDVHGRVVLPYDYMLGVDMAADLTGVTVSVWGWYE